MKMQMAAMTPAEAGKFLRNIAEMTARYSQNWDNFETIAADLIKSAYEATADTSHVSSPIENTGE